MSRRRRSIEPVDVFSLFTIFYKYFKLNQHQTRNRIVHSMAEEANSLESATAGSHEVVVDPEMDTGPKVLTVESKQSTRLTHISLSLLPQNISIGFSSAFDQGCPTTARSAPRRLPAVPRILHPADRATAQGAPFAAGRETAFQEEGRSGCARRGSPCGRSLFAHSIDYGRAGLGVRHATAPGVEHGAAQAIPLGGQDAEGLFVCAAIAGTVQGK